MLSLRLFLVIAALIGLSAAEKQSRDQKQFFGSITRSTTTSTSTSTLQTLTYCYSAKSTVTAACKRKKRNFIVDDSLDGDEALPAPSRTKREPRHSKVMDLEPSSEDEVAVRRDPRFFFLLSSTSTITATETSTLTAFTGTSTVSLNCIPTVINVCG